MTCPLSDVEPGKKCLIKAIKPSTIRDRFFEMGIFKDAEIEVVRTAPLKDPLECKIGNFYVGLRKSEASLIIVEQIS